VLCVMFTGVGRSPCGARFGQAVRMFGSRPSRRAIEKQNLLRQKIERENAQKPAAPLPPPALAPLEVTHNVKLPTRPEGIESDMSRSKFAIVAFSGTMYKVTPDDLIVCNLVEGAEVGKEFVLDDVRLVGGLEKTVIGRPTVFGAKVRTICEEITRDEKVIIMKRRRRKHKSRRTKGFRRDVTMLRIQSIDYELL